MGGTGVHTPSTLRAQSERGDYGAEIIVWRTIVGAPLANFGRRLPSFLRSQVLRDGFCLEFSILICAYTRLSKLDNL